MLEFENQAFLEIFHEDGLLIMAKGLGIERLLIKMIKVYSDPGNLVFVMGANENDQKFIIDHLIEEKVQHLPTVINSTTNTTERQMLYLQAGVLFITTRILVVDMLKDIVPKELITGIIVYKAHKVIESGQEAFILRLYREKNKTGFIKAFSESPNSFTLGFCHVERVMRNLFVKKLYLWPRFQATVCTTLESHKPEVEEIHVHLTPSMLAIQTSLLDIISKCIKELKRCNPSLDTDELSVENAISKSFDKVVNHQLEPIWHQLSTKTKQLITDLKTLKTLLINLVHYDSVTFYSQLQDLRSNEKNLYASHWLHVDETQSLFHHAKLRIFGASDSPKKKKVENDEEIVKIEENPKWKVLSEIIKEIEELDCNEASSAAVLIVADDNRTCKQLSDILSIGAPNLLKRLFEKFQNSRSAQEMELEEEKIKKSKYEAPKTSKILKEKVKRKKKNMLTLTQMTRENEATSSSQSSDKEEDDKNSPVAVSNQAIDPLKPRYPVIVIQPFKDIANPFGLINMMHQLSPKFVIMYDVNMGFVRQLEVYKAQNPYKYLRVYFLVYGSSAEEQSYLTILRKEKEAFELLIKEKAIMVIPEERDGKLENHPDLERNAKPANETVNPSSSRKGGFNLEKQDSQMIIVDMREFRSELPSLIHRRGIDVIPMTLEVGDYILTPDICVERKSVSDLIGSLNSGRLYNQALAMTRYYKKPLLLIEFDHNKPFTLQNRYYISQDASSQDVTSKLVLLTLHFPQLKILWCASPYATAELFEELKKGKPQPSLEQANVCEELPVDKYNIPCQDFVQRLPGINSKNCFAILNRGGSLADLAKLSQEDLVGILGNSIAAKDLWEAFHLPSKELPKNSAPLNKGAKKMKKR